MADFDRAVSNNDKSQILKFYSGNILIEPPEIYEENIYKEEVVDTYQMATLLYETVVGKKPFMHINWEPDQLDDIRRYRFYLAHKRADFFLPEHLPESIKKILTKGLQPDPTMRYQSMEEMLSDMLEAYYSPENMLVQDNLVQQVRLTYTQDISLSLALSPDAKLHVSEERQNYLNRQEENYLRKLNEVDIEISESMNAATQIVSCITVANKMDLKNMYRALSNYNGQSLARNNFELIVLVDLEEQQDMAEAINKEEVSLDVERIRNDYPALPVRIAYVTVPRSQVREGNLRKIVSDLALLRQQKAGISTDVLLISDDVRNEGIDSHYLENNILYFNEHPDKDAAFGNVQYSPRNALCFPDIYTNLAFIKQLENTPFLRGDVSGLSETDSVMKTSIYAAVGGYASALTKGEQWQIGETIKQARKSKNCLGYIGNSLVVKDNTATLNTILSEYHIQLSINGERQINNMPAYDSTTFPFFQWLDPRGTVRIQAELERRLNDTIAMYEQAEHLGKDAWYYTSNLDALGITYRVEGDPLGRDSRIIITDMSRFIENQERMKQAMSTGETNMAKVLA